MRPHRILLPAALAAVLPCDARTETPEVTPPGADDDLVALNCFAGWWHELPDKWHGQGWRIDQPDWRPDIPERVPTLGEYSEQATMDREIIAASEHGVELFAMIRF